MTHLFIMVIVCSSLSLQMVAGRRGPGGVGVAGHVLKAFSFVVEHVRTQHQEMAVECALG